MTEKDIKIKLEEFREKYVQSYNSPSTQMDLREHFYLVRNESKAIHELMALMYDDIHKVMINNKTLLLQLIDKGIQTDTELYNYLLTIEHDLKFNKPQKSLFFRIFTWSNIFKFLFAIGAILLILFILYEINPAGFDDIFQKIFKTIDKFRKK